MAESINYGQDRSALALQYENLRKAVANRGLAENAREAREIEKKGLFGTGIKSSDLQDFGNIAITGAELGDARMGKKMDRAEKSFGRRQAADERRLKTLQNRLDKGQLDEAGVAEMDGIQYGMKERRDSFEDFMGKYQEKGLWGTKFGGDDVGYRTEGESRYSQALGKGGSEDGTDWSNLGDLGEGQRTGKGFNDVRNLGDFERSVSQPGTDQKLSGHRKIGENAPNEYEEKFGEGSSGIMNLGGIEAKDQTSPSMTPHRRFPSYMEQFPKKKANLGVPIEGTTSNKFTDDPPSGGPPGRDNYRRALPDALAQAGLSAEERAALDAAEKEELIKEKYLVDQNKQEYGSQIQGVLAKRKRKLLEELVSGIDLN